MDTLYIHDDVDSDDYYSDGNDSYDDNYSDHNDDNDYDDTKNNAILIIIFRYY